MNNNTENVYCDGSGNIFNSLNNSLQDYLYTSHYNPNYPFLHFKKLQNYVMSFPRVLYCET